jgi:crotonobetainyl-CoA:carnitine CoA-transferase CaiB-like acyl-CoA transferase
MAWLDPMCGLMLAFGTAAALWRRARSGPESKTVARIDFSMLEAMLWTMAEPLLQAQLGDGPYPVGNYLERHAPHGVYRCTGNDDWLAIDAADDAQWRALCASVPALAPLAALGLAGRRERRREIDAALAAWARSLPAQEAAAALVRGGVPAAALATSRDLVDSPHLKARDFWEAHGDGVLPGLPWRASFGHAGGPAPALGTDTDAVLRDVLGLGPNEIATLRDAGAFG